MKRILSLMLAVLLLLSCVLVGTPQADAEKVTESRAIAIVFDNSGSMYVKGNQAWCRATYAMEVFASMLNTGDELQIYPMYPITAGGKEYSMDEPLKITNPTDASVIRNIFTPYAGATPIESIDAAAEGLKKTNAEKKYLLILTDGTTFYHSKSGIELEYSTSETKKELENRIKTYASKDMTVMYLGIQPDNTSDKVCRPSVNSEYYVMKIAENSTQVLSNLTEMCNQIFGRDALSDKYVDIKKSTMKFDISMRKLIVFVQGENISDLKITGKSVGTMVGSPQQVKYSTEGAGAKYADNDLKRKCVPDTSLQGMIVTYTGCGAGDDYKIEYKGTAKNIELYYEPDADLSFVFTDAEGNEVNPNELYEGEYMVSYGMKDAKTGKLISSELLGKTSYKGSYFIDGKEVKFSSEKANGSEKVYLKKDQKFDANLTVTYLSRYTLHKTSKEFGWPPGGITIAPRPVGEFNLEITGGQEEYSLQKLEEGKPFIVKVKYQGEYLKGDVLKSVEPVVGTSNAKIEKEFAEDHWKLWLRYTDAADPQKTVCGDCTVPVEVTYTPQGSNAATVKNSFSYFIKDDFSPLQMELFVPEVYIVIADLEESQPYVANLKMRGKLLTEEEFAAVKLEAFFGDIELEPVPNQKSSSYSIKLPTGDFSEGDYLLKITATYTDSVGKESQVSDQVEITLSNMPLWLKWLIGISLLILLIVLIWIILHIRKFPKYVRHDADGCSLSVGGRDVGGDATFNAKRSGKSFFVAVEFNGEEIGRASLNRLSPGKESYLYKPSPKRSFLAKFPESISVSGELTKVEVGAIEYVMNKDNDMVPAEEQQAPYTITNGTSVTIKGKTMVAGKMKSFNAVIPLIFKKG